MRSCIEQLQLIEKESNALDVSQKALADLRDQLDQKKGERLELEMRREVCLPLYLPSVLLLASHF